MTGDARADAAIAAARRGRGPLKRAAEALRDDAEARAALVARVVALAPDVAQDAADWPAKRLLRWALDRSDAAQVTRTLTARDEAFVCVRCGRDVPPAGRTARDHCPWCLTSRHLDVVPGDRASTCRAPMQAIGLEVRGADLVLTYRCEACDATFRVRALQDVAVPDDPTALRALSARTPQ